MHRVMMFPAVALVTLAGTSLGAPGPIPPSASPVETFQIGTSVGGRAITAWRLGSADPDEFGRAPDQRPALLIVAGLDGRHDFGSRVAISLVDRLVTEHAALLDRYTIYVVPNLNPDNDAMFDRPGTPRAEFGRAPRSADADRDGRFDEDPADDLNNDGMITMMRVKNPAPGTGLRPTLVLDPDEPRLLREPDADEGEIAEYAVLIEGIDNDGDGTYNEDGIAGSAGGGVDLDRNFPSLWPEYADGAGPHALSEPETRSLVEWMLEHDNIVCTLAYTPRDNILNTPAAGKFAKDGREPTGIEEGDKNAYERVQELFKEATNQTGAPKGEWAGSFTQFAYAQFGVWSFATPAWVRPDLVKQETADEDKGNGNEDAEAETTGDGGFDAEAERKALQDNGTPAFVVDFIVASPEERTAFMESFQDMPEGERASNMQAVMALPEAIQLRVRALISGQPDPGPFASGGGGDENGGGAKRGGRSSGKGSKNAKGKDSDDAKWIKYADEHLNGTGFVEWTPFTHPQLGEVEIGGFVPGVKHEPDESEWVRVVDEQAQFVAGLVEMLPDLEVTTTHVERVTGGVWRIGLRGTNPGVLPTRAAIGAKARRIPPIVVSLGVEVDDILTGSRINRWESIAGNGGYEEIEWVVRAADGSDIQIEVRSSVFGNRTHTVELTQDN
ncbi:MAG: M14 family zinc carboxypeptidase [Planctomycetota bacterium]|nr:M14 family zinc carboxypeptidase [Planctomycetota bacterium]